MAIPERTFTAAEFDEFILLPEHGDTLFELINGTVYPVVSNNRSSRIGASILIAVGSFVKAKELGYVTGADGGYIVAGERLMPDLAFMSRVRQPRRSKAAYNPLAPDLAVEVLSPSDSESNVRIKLADYLSAGTTVWIVDPDSKTVEIHSPNKPSLKLTESDMLDGGDVMCYPASPCRSAMFLLTRNSVSTEAVGTQQHQLQSDNTYRFKTSLSATSTSGFKT